MPDLLYRSLVWLAVRLGMVFAVGLPLVLLVWSSLQQEAALQRLLGLYWKVASLLLIALLLLTNGASLGTVLLLVASLLILGVLWFWVDINEELADFPLQRALPLTVRIWRWSLSGFCLALAVLAATSLPCQSAGMSAPLCKAWLEAPGQLHGVLAQVFGFVFGADWSEGLAGFLGYLGLMGYGVGLLQWLLVRLPRQGRVAGEF